MKYEQIDDYVNALFAKTSQDEADNFYDRVDTVKSIILSESEKAMQWHSSQIAPAGPVMGDMAKPSGGGCIITQPGQYNLDDFVIVSLDNRPVRLNVTYQQANAAMEYANSQGKSVTPIEFAFWILAAICALAIALPICQIITRIMWGAKW